MSTDNVDTYLRRNLKFCDFSVEYSFPLPMVQKLWYNKINYGTWRVIVDDKVARFYGPQCTRRSVSLRLVSVELAPFTIKVKSLTS